MTRSDRLRDLALHLEWADAAVWRAVLESADQELDSRLENWLHHIHSVQHAFLCIWQGETLEIRGRSDFPDPPSLARWGREAHRGIQSYLAAADEADLGRELSIPWSEELSESWGGPIGPVSLEQSAIQVAMHSTHHRGQVAARLRELGGEPPLVDFIAWLWWKRPEPEWPAALDAEGGGP